MAHIYWRLQIFSGTFPCVNEWVPYDGAGTQIATTGGTASADNSAFGAAANAFDGNASTFWSANNTFPHWLQYQFPSAVEIASFTILSNNGGFAKAIIDFDLQYSDDGSTWFTKYSYRGVSWSSIGPITFNASNALPVLGIAWRLLVNSTYATVAQIDITDIVFRDGGGSAIATSQYAATAYSTYTGDTTHGAYAAFDGNGATYWSANGITVPGWIAYRFGSLVQVASFCITPVSPQGPSSVTLQYSFDETNWTSAGTFSVANGSTQQCFTLGATLPATATITASPSVGVQGSTYTVTITGTNTHFASGSTSVSFSGAGGTVSGVSVASATSLTFSLALSATAATGAQTITVTTGAEAPTATFTVGAGARGNIDFDQIGLDARHGQTGTKIQYSDNTGTALHLASFDSAGNLTDSGISTAGGGGSGTITSVALTVPSDKSVSGSPITSSGTLAISDNAQSANTIKAGPSSGSAATPGYRALVAADLPLATTGAFGAVKPDGTTITIASGVISSSGGGSSGYPPLAITTPPSVSSLTWINQNTTGSATGVNVTSGAIVLAATAFSGTNHHALVKTLPAAPYTFTVLLSVDLIAGSNYIFGMAWTDGTKLRVFGYTNASGFAVLNYNSASSFNSTAISAVGPYVVPSTFWLQGFDDGTNVHFRFSMHGAAFLEAGSIARASFLTATSIGIVMDCENNHASNLCCISWSGV